MNWSDVTREPAPRLLRQFAALSLVIFGGLAAWRAASGAIDGWMWGLATAAVVIGGVGLIAPRAIRWVFTGWMIVAFPIGWLISRIVLAVLYFVVFTPVALFFRVIGRDALHRRTRTRQTYWTAKPAPSDVKSYFRQY